MLEAVRLCWDRLKGLDEGTEGIGGDDEPPEEFLESQRVASG